MTEELVLELCADYNGLGMAIEAALGARVAAFSEYDKAPSKILAHRYPGVPNYGDMTKIDWAALNYHHGPITCISGGTPCQDLSHAGKRRGMTEGTRSNLWVNMREAIAIIRPEWVIWENVRGAYSADATSEMEFCPGCMGETADRGSVLRALGRVLGDLSDLGYDTKWRGLRAADVGAPHSRFRVFVVARRRDAAPHDTRGHGGNQAEQHDGSRAAADHWASLPDQPDRLLGGIGPLGIPTAPNPGSDGHEGLRGRGDGEGPRGPVEGSGGAPRDTDGEDGQGSLSAGDDPVRGADQAGQDRSPGAGPADPAVRRGDAQQPAPAREGHQPARGRSGGQPATQPKGERRRKGRTQSEGIQGRPDAPISSDTAAADPGSSGQHRGTDQQGEGRHEGLGAEAIDHPGDGDPSRRHQADEAPADPGSEHRGQRRQPAPGEAPGGQPPAEHSGRGGAPAPADADGGSDAGRIEDPQRTQERGEAPAGDSGGAINWGAYEPAIRRWERIIGRPAPRPTEPTGRDNGQRLSARFTEWMMGLPDGWVTDPAIGISRNEQLKACGNGVVPQQAYAAIMHMLAEYEQEQQAA